MKEVQLTKAQAEAVAWALDPMGDYWCSENEAWGRDGPVYDDADLPKLKGTVLVLSPVDEINEDILYRLEEQLPDMIRQDPEAPRNGATAALRAARLIRDVTGYEGSTV